MTCGLTEEVIARSRTDGGLDSDVKDGDSDRGREDSDDANTDADVESSSDADLSPDTLVDADSEPDTLVDADSEPDTFIDADFELDADDDTRGDSDVDEGGDDADVDGNTGGIGMTAAASHTCMWLDGNAWCWGANNQGQLGDGTTEDRPTPVRVAGLTEVVGMTAGDSTPDFSPNGHTCAWKGDGSAWCWGSNEFGQLGDGMSNDLSEPTLVELPPVAGLTAGGGHSCAWTIDGRAWCWGRGEFGRLGNNGHEGSLLPFEITDLTGVRSMSAGFQTTCAVLDNGSVYCWGLWLTMDGYHLVPHQVPSLNEVVNISVGNEHCCAKQVDRSILCWGQNYFGQLGIGSTTPASYPLSVDLSDIAGVSAGGSLSCGWMGDESIDCWGWHVGDGVGEIHELPFTIPGLSGIIGATAGSEYGCAWTSDGSAFCWGSNTYGQLGNGGFRHELSPVQIAPRE